MDIVDVFVGLVLLSVVAYVIYTPYLAIMRFLDRQQHKYIKPKRIRTRREAPQNYTHLLIAFDSIISMLTRIAKSDGVISEPEADVIKSSITHFVHIARAEGFGTSTQETLRQRLIQAHNEAKVVNYPISAYAQLLVNYDTSLKVQVIQQLIVMASIDGYTPLKESLIFNAGKALGFHHSHIKRYIDDMFGVKQAPPREDSNAYTVLGCNSTDDNATIKKRYRELVKKHHPDFIQPKTKDNPSLELAKQKIQEINNAYDAIKKERGI